MANPNILSARYATPEINEIFSPQGKIVAERDLWIAVMKAQRELGVDIPAEVIEKYEAARLNVNMGLIASIERKTKHDIKARIEAFIQAADTGEHIHKGMTSRDLTDNVEQMQILRASKIVFGKYVSVLRHFLDKAHQYRDIILAGRTHHQPAQPTLLGRRIAMWAEELYHHLETYEAFIESYPLRGVKGPVGTQLDMLALLGSGDKVIRLEDMVAKQLGFGRVLEAPGQVYPRSMDYALLVSLAALGSACENFAKGMRLMSGFELVTEGFGEGQVGSSAMPHKMNTRNCERICGFAELLKMYADGASRLAGDQWEEGDVSCSVVRRAIIPDAFYVSDGLCETTLTVLNEMGPYPVMLEAEVDRYLPFLATTEILNAAVVAGMGREAAHEIIRQHAISEALRMRREGKPPRLAEKLAQAPVFKKAGITEEKIESLLQDKKHFVGNAQRQIAAVVKKGRELIGKYEAQSKYEPQGIL
ncbi:MAG: adenylosuccinate lyase [candidate division Zixibacteria bacterium SM23_81]|nr:MAG: adenylosuccinate lyase [candidate division Zixibacteria bacterium SM23_81]